MAALRLMGPARPRPFGPGVFRPRPFFSAPPAAADSAVWTSTELTGAELAARQADRPVIIAYHCLRDAFRTLRKVDLSDGAGARWVAAGGTMSSPDIGDPDYPIYRLWDGHGHRVTRSTAADCALLIDFGSDNLQEFDAIYVAGCATPGGSSSLQVEVFYDAGLIMGQDTPVLFSGSTAYGANRGPAGAAMAHARLGTGSTPTRYSGVRYMSLTFANWTTAQIGELWLGRSYQLPRHFDTPQSDRREISTVAGGEASCGLTARRTRNTGAAHLPASLTLDGDTEVDDARDYWWRPSHEGTRPVVIITTPYTGAFGRLVRTPGAPVFDPVATGPNSRSLGVELAEASDFAGDAP